MLAVFIVSVYFYCGDAENELVKKSEKTPEQHLTYL
jgi:hypothetical protein